MGSRYFYKCNRLHDTVGICRIKTLPRQFFSLILQGVNLMKLSTTQDNINIMMKRFYTFLLALALTSTLQAAEGWPSNYGGVMLQGFYWDSFWDSKWTNLEKQAWDFGQQLDLVWIPQSAYCGGQSMGYDDLYWFTNYNSSFGTETELRSLIKTFKQAGIGTIADVVINHRRNVSNWVDFPTETYKGVTYQLKSTDICRDDDKYYDDAAKTWVYPCLAWANKNGYQISANNDTGEGWGGMRDLDHKSENVQKNVKAYLHMLLEDLGYTGFRYDMVKGYSAEYTKIYNTDSNPKFSVGECWDGSSTIMNWIDGTGKTSAAFDFQFKYVVRNATDKNDWTYLGKQNDGNWPLVSTTNTNYRRYAVTFVENHDTEVRPDGSSNGPLKNDTLAANAYLLSMPGTPCVFYKHWKAFKREIKAMIDARKMAGITNESAMIPFASNKDYYVVRVNGTNAPLLCVVGASAATYTPNGQWIKILSGPKYAYYFAPTAETPFVTLGSGEYEAAQKAQLVAVSQNSAAQLVYTTNGSAPTASNGTRVATGTEITIPVGETTLKVGLLVNGAVTKVITRTYKISEPSSFEPYDITIHVNVDKVGWSPVNFWTWGEGPFSGKHATQKGAWPGDAITATKQVGGKTWYYKTDRITAEGDAANIVVSTGTGSPQTVNFMNITKDVYLEVQNEKDATETSKYVFKDVTSDYTTGIVLDEGLRMKEESNNSLSVYDLQGRKIADDPSSLISNPTFRKGIYIVGGKKVVIR